MPADLEQLQRSRLDALGGVDDHDGGIDRRQRAIGIVGEVFVAGRIEHVEDIAVIFEGHHRGDDRDAAFALDLHPVRAGLDAVLLRLDFAGKLDGAAEQQQLFGQRRLAGIRVGDNSKGAAAGDRLGETFGHDVEIPVEWPRYLAISWRDLQLTWPNRRQSNACHDPSRTDSSPHARASSACRMATGIDLPAYETAGAAGMDLRAAVTKRPAMLLPGKRALVPTGFIFEIPAGLRGADPPALRPCLQARHHLPQYARHDRQRLSRRGEGPADQSRRGGLRHRTRHAHRPDGRCAGDAGGHCAQGDGFRRDSARQLAVSVRPETRDGTCKLGEPDGGFRLVDARLFRSSG